MKKYLLYTAIIFSVVANAQIMYWDFGAKELGDGYTNALPLSHLNAFANYTRQIDWVDGNGAIVTNYADGVAYAPKAGYENENGQSVSSIFYTTFNQNYSDPNYHFQLSSKGSSPTPPGGTLLSGESLYTKPQMMPDLDGNVDLVFKKDSNSDKLITTRTDITRYDDFNQMPDGMDKDLFPGCLEYTTPGEKRYNRSGGRGLLINLEAGQWVTVVGSGQYVPIDSDPEWIDTYGYSTGYIKFETFGGTGTPVDIDDFGAGKGSFDGTTPGDEAVRVMQFQAIDAGTYSLSNRGGTIRIYRVYLGKVDADLGPGLETKIYENGVYKKSLSTTKITETFPLLTSNKNSVILSNVTKPTDLKIFNITGALLKSLKLTHDTTFFLKQGIYIASVKNADGKKTVKLLVK